jgi:predicted nuclease of restriction endonuclease-like (RecB) superfamily
VPPALPSGYPAVLADLTARVRAAQVRAAVAVNAALVGLYWEIGRAILSGQQAEGWGAKVVDQLAGDLRRAFPTVRGFSRRNLQYMRALAEAWPDGVGEGALASISWYQHVTLLDKLATAEERRWYAAQAVAHGWSRNVLAHHIDTNLRGRHGKALTNFSRTLPAPQSDLAQEVTKSHYLFDFLELSAEADERALERGLIARFRDFFRELGRGFAFLGSQVPLEVDGKEYRPDLLFYHVRLHCYVVVELKVGEFEPADAGQLSFYVTAVDRQLRDAARDEPTLGLLLCRSRSALVVEYTLEGVHKPVGVTTYEHLTALRPGLPEALPSPDELRREFAEAERGAQSERAAGGPAATSEAADAD